MLEHIDQLLLPLHIDEYTLQLSFLAERLNLQQLNKIIEEVFLLLNNGDQLLPFSTGV